VVERSKHDAFSASFVTQSEVIGDKDDFMSVYFTTMIERRKHGNAYVAVVWSRWSVFQSSVMTFPILKRIHTVLFIDVMAVLIITESQIRYTTNKGMKETDDWRDAYTVRKTVALTK